MSRKWNQDAFAARFFLKTSTVALANVKTNNSDHMEIVLMALFGMLNRKLNRNQNPVIAVGTLTTIQSSVHV